MEKVTFRSIRSDLWRDPDKMHWTAEDLGFWCCISSNDRTSLCGVYAIHIRELAFLSRVSEDACKALLKRFIEYGEVQYNHATHELAIKSWMTDHPLVNLSMALGAQKQAEEVKDKSLLVFVNYSSSVDSALNKYQKDTKQHGDNTVPPPCTHPRDTGLGLGLGEDQEVPKEPLDSSLPEDGLNSAREEAPPTAPTPDPAHGPAQEVPPVLAKLLGDIEATGKRRASKFAMTTVVRDRFIALGVHGVTAAATAWADFLKAKGTKLHVPQVVLEDLPEFLAKRLELLDKPPPASVFPESGKLRRSAAEVLHKQALADPVTDEHRAEMEAFMKAVKTGQVRAS